MTLEQLLAIRPDLRPVAALMRGAYELHGMDFARAFNPSSEVWAAEIHAGTAVTPKRDWMDDAA